MTDLRRRLDRLDDFFDAVEGYTDLPVDQLVQVLLDHFVVDLDLLGEFARMLEHRTAATPAAVAA
ncbi:hypothetical protein [Polymorphum gilvum]|uniref:hypothetical protein n=1 Tax=Polymorphum gilvum TaxID=991904 RepID=UPI0002D9B8EF|nr:hypothetical protein [Polymorphum gilvum]